MASKLSSLCRSRHSYTLTGWSLIDLTRANQTPLGLQDVGLYWLRIDICIQRCSGSLSQWFKALTVPNCSGVTESHLPSGCCAVASESIDLPNSVEACASHKSSPFLFSPHRLLLRQWIPDQTKCFSPTDSTFNGRTAPLCFSQMTPWWDTNI